MATYDFSVNAGPGDGEVLNGFVPGRDKLAFSSDYSAAGLLLIARDAGVQVQHGELSVILSGVAPAELGGAQLEFTDGSVVVRSDGSPGPVAGGAGGDLLLGSPGNDHLDGVAGHDRLAGGDGNDTLDGGSGSDTLDGGNGDDTYFIDVATDTIVEASDGGTDTVRSGISFVLGSHQENLVLTGSLALDATGNELANLIEGNSGANIVRGGGGDDVMKGYDGNDTYHVDDAGDSVEEAASGGVDTVVASLSYTLGSHLEHLTLTGAAAAGTGNALANLIIGTAAANDLKGGDGADTLQGGEGNDTLDGGAGMDLLAGGAGNDTYLVDGAGDALVEEADAGTDTVLSSLASHTLGEHLEHLTLTGSGALNATGNALANVITGNSGANVLRGGAGNDSMTGGGGNDSYLVDDAGDEVIESDASGGGEDAVVSSLASYTLGQHLEHLTLTGAALAGTGNALANLIRGNALANTLTGGAGNDTLDGGAGADTMAGGAGRDVYIVDAAGDTVTEASNGGIDTVLSSLAGYTLGSNLENLTLTGSALAGTGNALANEIRGNALTNTLTGGAGNDTYHVDSASDRVVEAADGGVDTVVATATFVLGEHQEHLTLTGGGAINGSGNRLANRILGTAGSNSIDGGAGADTMAGGAGSDTYTVDDAGDRVEESNASNGGHDRVNSSVSWTLGAFVEALTLTGTRNISGTGNALNNLIAGNAGNNAINGGAGSDMLLGGNGNDTYTVDGSDRIFEGAGAGSGVDLVRAHAVNYVLGANLENLEFITNAAVQGAGNALANRLQGTALSDFLDGLAGADVLLGLAGNDTLSGGADADKLYGGAGNDQLSGGLGQDKLYGEAGDDKLAADAGNDLLDGGDGADHLFGAAGNDSLAGGAGQDTLDGGAGSDRLAGGAGDDTYFVDSAADVVTESRAAGGGTDLLVSSVSRVLGSYQENLMLTGTRALAGTGNTLANRLFGNDGNNVLDGARGADTMVGGKGNDTYHVDNARDAIGEAGSGGTDTVISRITFGLGSHQENLTLAGTGHLTGTGNALANVIRGNAGDNALVGGGGRDTLVGGLGKDTYYVDEDDVIVEGRSTDVDLVVATGSRTLGNYQDNLVFQGAGAYQGVGNALANVIVGGSGGDLLEGGRGADQLQGRAGNDTLRGGDHDDYLSGGAGKDLLTGGAGSDRFAYLTAADSGRSNFDVIADFVRGKDRIDLSQMDARAATARVDDFSFLGDAAFSQDATGQVRFDYDARTGTLMVYASTDADSSAEFALQVMGATSLAGSDFLG